uniref:Uncharacterized protein n=1 Tax=Picea sitchensis TaxID=3332 RepID=A9NWK9_PICSI|nr:unknown [Picea sitchensis]
MFQGKLICLYTGNRAVACSIWNAMEHFRDNIYIIYIGYNFSRIGFTENISKDYLLKIFTENTTETEGMPLSNLSMHETVRFAMRLDHLEEEINGMDESDKQLCELKSLLHSVQLRGSITFMDERGGMVAAFRGYILESIFLSDRKDRAQLVIKSMMEDFGGGGGKEMHDQDPGVSESLIKNMQTAVEQENMDVYLDSLRNYISELRGVELYQLLNVNKVDCFLWYLS